MPFVSGSGSKTGFSGRKFLCFEEVLFGAAIFFGERGEKLREIAIEQPLEKMPRKKSNVGYNSRRKKKYERAREKKQFLDETKDSLLLVRGCAW